MKKLIIVESVGKGTKTDKKVVKIVKKNEDAELFIFCNEFVLNENGEYIRTKGVKILPSLINPGVTFTEEFDEIVEIGEFGKENSAKFNVVEKEKSTVEGKPVKRDITRAELVEEAKKLKIEVLKKDTKKTLIKKIQEIKNK